MEFTLAPKLEKRAKADLIILPFWKGGKKVEIAADCGPLEDTVAGAINTGDFKGKEGETLFLYPSSVHSVEKRILLLGLGEEKGIDKKEIGIERLRRAFAAASKACQAKKIEDITLVLPEISGLSEKEILRGVSEGLLLANYLFDKLKNKSLKENPTVLLKKAHIISAAASTAAKNQDLLKEIKKHQEICRAVYLARDLINSNADEITPQYLAHLAQDLAKKNAHLKTTVFDKKRIEKEGMGLLLAVNRGSSRDPAFIIMEYQGNPKSKDKSVIVGKGITYDTGGLNLKPTGSMETMKCDMGGAAVCFGTICSLLALKLKVNVTVVIPTTENSIGSRSYKPGDVYPSYLGKTVEISNTDAEGRLILADALAYAVAKLKPTRIIDFATLTGSVEIALGAEATGMFSNDEGLAEKFTAAGLDTYERVWRLPIYDEYRDQLKSEIADLKNSAGRAGGAITAAKFLQEFVGETPWVHFDIAATAYLNEARRYHPKFGTGIGVRLMISYLETLSGRH
jgi:leucyl aminopeptidase